MKRYTINQWLAIFTNDYHDHVPYFLMINHYEIQISHGTWWILFMRHSSILQPVTTEHGTPCALDAVETLGLPGHGGRFRSEGMGTSGGDQRWWKLTVERQWWLDNQPRIQKIFKSPCITTNMSMMFNMTFDDSKDPKLNINLGCRYGTTRRHYSLSPTGTMRIATREQRARRTVPAVTVNRHTITWVASVNNNDISIA